MLHADVSCVCFAVKMIFFLLTSNLVLSRDVLAENLYACTVSFLDMFKCLFRSFEWLSQFRPPYTPFFLMYLSLNTYLMKLAISDIFSLLARTCLMPRDVIFSSHTNTSQARDVLLKKYFARVSQKDKNA